MTERETAAVEVLNVRKAFGPHVVLDGISFTIKQGEIVAIMGRSGSGKTTVLRCLDGLEPVDSGVIRVLGYPVAGAEKNDGSNAGTHGLSSIDHLRARVGLVFQHLYLWPHKTVFENLAEALRIVKRKPARDAEETCLRLLERVGLSDKKHAYPHMLSGGQQQRAALARALAMEPEVLMLDEVTSALDPELVSEVLDVIKDLMHQAKTVLIVTHEIRFAREAASRILFVDSGKILEDASPQAFFDSPRNERVQRFLERVSKVRM